MLVYKPIRQRTVNNGMPARANQPGTKDEEFPVPNVID
jgi:hypothetical protein